jgi:hypothetical protein
MSLKSKKLIGIMVASLVWSIDLGWAQVKRAAPMPKIQTIAEGVVMRTSDNNDPHRGDLPPWTQVEITNVFGFKRSPKTGDKVTIVPLDVDIAPFELTITKTQKKTQCSGPGGEIWWQVDFESVKDKRFFEQPPLPNRREEYPFDVAVIYPTVEYAQQIKRSELVTNMLPRGIYINTVKAALDLTRDGIPEVLLVEYCCQDPKKSPGECDYMCGKTFQKSKIQWKLIDITGPC